MPQPDFNNTAIAFAHKSNADLKKARLLFNSFKFPLLVNYGPPLAAFALKLHLPIKGIIKNTIFAQFCGGETISDCAKAIDNLNKSHIGTILDYSVEGEEKEEVFDATCKEIVDTVLRAAGNTAIPFSVFKATGIGRFDILAKVNANETLTTEEQEEYQRFYNRFETICKSAYDNKVRLFVDAEETWIQDTIDNLTYEMMAKYNQDTAIIYNTIQCYRKDRIAHINTIINTLKCHIGFKIVRGAYMEKERARAIDKGYPSPIQDTKALTDNEYNEAITLCLNHIDRVAICAGTHNEDSSHLLADLMAKKGIANNNTQLYFAQLLGMSDHISYNLANAGYNVAKYVPYGPVRAVLPYLGRRAKENSSVKGQVGRELKLITEELKRRSKQ